MFKNDIKAINEKIYKKNNFKLFYEENKEFVEQMKKLEESKTDFTIFEGELMSIDEKIQEYLQFLKENENINLKNLFIMLEFVKRNFGSDEEYIDLEIENKSYKALISFFRYRFYFVFNLEYFKTSKKDYDNLEFLKLKQFLYSFFVFIQNNSCIVLLDYQEKLNDYITEKVY